MSEENNAEAVEDQTPGLSYGDITASVQIIDAATSRGAIRGEELVSVGTVRERLVAFLAYAKSQGEEVEVPPSAMDQAQPEQEAEAE